MDPIEITTIAIEALKQLKAATNNNNEIFAILNIITTLLGLENLTKEAQQ